MHHRIRANLSSSTRHRTSRRIELNLKEEKNLSHDHHQTTTHHRRPRSLLGGDQPANLATVDPYRHAHWHTLFGNMNALQIVQDINMHWRPYNMIVSILCIGSPVKKEGVEGSPRFEKRRNSWNQLFGDMNFEDAIHVINTIWMDPSYILSTERIDMKFEKNRNLQDHTLNRAKTLEDIAETIHHEEISCFLFESNSASH